MSQTLSLLDHTSECQEFLSDVLCGLAMEPKELPCKYFYDQRGSRLFDSICELDEYYPTRTEVGIMRTAITEMASLLGSRCCLIEYGSGSSVKTRLLLDALDRPAAYVPIDISRDHLHETAERLAISYPDVQILPVCADYTDHFNLPSQADRVGRKTVYFPGSTIGNFHPWEAIGFLARIASHVPLGSGLLIGVDLKKDPAILNAAYNDRDGVTAEFNLNLLVRMNRELDADFDFAQWRHHAAYNHSAGCIEMFLISCRRQSVRIGGRVVEFEAGERIRTECSYKYSLGEFANVAAQAGFRVDHVWTDPRAYFSVQYLTLQGA
jgi:dimethylhistidine N-methyltransferase